MNQSRFSEAGFSLVELLLSAVLMVTIFTIFGAFVMHFQKGAAQFQERAKQTEDNNLTAHLVTTDLERAGTNLSLPSKQSFTGQIFVPFEPSNQYVITDHQVFRQKQLSADPLLSSVLWRGKGALDFRAGDFAVTLRDVADSSDYRRIEASGNVVSIVERGETVATTSRFVGTSALSISVSSIMENYLLICQTRYLMDGRQIYQSNRPCTEAQHEIAVELPLGNYLFDLSLTAADIALRDSGSFPVRLPLLPVYDGTRMTLPLLSDLDHFSILAGDDQARTMFLAVDTVFSPGNNNVQLNEASVLKNNDLLLVCDYFNNRSVLLKVIERSESTVGNVTVAPVLFNPIDTVEANKFYSLLDDFSGFVFERGTRVVKLAPFIEYRVAVENAKSALYRRTNGAIWELVVPDVKNFVLSQNIQSTSINYELNLEVASEGVELRQTVQPLRLSVNPRALNRTYDAR